MQNQNFKGEIESYFIAFEGIDGSGKSSLIRAISKQLKKDKKKFFLTAEPSKNSVGSVIRNIIARKNSGIQFNHLIFPYLFAIDRYKHIYESNGILEHINNNELVLCDRYLFSSYVYQGSKEQQKFTLALNADFPLPGLLFYLDIGVETAFERMKARKKEGSIFENPKTLTEFRKRYLQLIEEVEESTKIRCHKVDAALPLETLKKHCVSLIYNYLNSTKLNPLKKESSIFENSKVLTELKERFRRFIEPRDTSKKNETELSERYRRFIEQILESHRRKEDAVFPVDENLIYKYFPKIADI